MPIYFFLNVGFVSGFFFFYNAFFLFCFSRGGLAFWFGCSRAWLVVYCGGREGEMDDEIRKDGDKYMSPWRNQQYDWAQTTLFSLSRVKLHVWYVCT